MIVAIRWMVLAVSFFLSWFGSEPASGQSFATSTSLNVASPTVNAGQDILATAQIASASVSVVEGFVLFVVDGEVRAEVPVVESPPTSTQPARAVASLTLTLPSGNHQIQANFSDYGTLTASSSPMVTVSVGLPISGSLSITAGSQAPGVISYAMDFPTAKAPSGTLRLQNVTDGITLGSVEVDSAAVAQPADHLLSVTGGITPVAFVSGDFDGNGLDDLAIVDQGSSSLVILLSDKDGRHFHSAPAVPTQPAPTAIATADFNGDGIQDLAVIDATSGSLQIFLGDPDHRGEFVSLETPMTLSVGISAILAADINNDGVVDILVANPLTNTVTVLFGMPSDPGHFTVAQTVTVTAGVTNLAVGNLYGNGLQDIVVTSFSEGSVSILENSPTAVGTFIAPRLVSMVGLGPMGLAIGDLNGNGIPDIAVCNSLDGTVSVLLGDASAPGQYAVQRVVTVGPNPVSIAVMPSGAGGLNDLVVGNSGDGSVEILENGGDASFLTSHIIYAGEGVRQVAVLNASTAASRSIAQADDSANVIRILRRDWQITGQFPSIAMTSPAPTEVQAIFDQPWTESQTPLVSNEFAPSGVQPSPQQLIFTAPKAVTYGTPITLQAVSSSGLPVTFRLVSGQASLVGATLTPTAVASIVVEAVQAGSSAVLAASARATISVQPAPLVASGTSATMMFGQQPPVLSGNLVGVVNGDDIVATFTTQASALTPPGTYSQGMYAINPLLSDPAKHLGNYTVTLTPGTLTIGALISQQITVIAPASMTYGAAVALQANSSSGLPVSMQVLSGPGILTGSTLTSTATGQIIIQASQAGSSSYQPASASQTIGVVPAPLNATGSDATMVFGGQPPALTGTLLGVVNGDNITATFASQANATTPVGVYAQGVDAINPLLNDSGQLLGNYTVTLAPGILTITQACQPTPKPIKPLRVAEKSIIQPCAGAYQSQIAPQSELLSEQRLQTTVKPTIASTITNSNSPSLANQMHHSGLGSSDPNFRPTPQIESRPSGLPPVPLAVRLPTELPVPISLPQKGNLTSPPEPNSPIHEAKQTKVEPLQPTQAEAPSLEPMIVLPIPSLRGHQLTIPTLVPAPSAPTAPMRLLGSLSGGLHLSIALPSLNLGWHNNHDRKVDGPILLSLAGQINPTSSKVGLTLSVIGLSSATASGEFDLFDNGDRILTIDQRGNGESELDLGIMQAGKHSFHVQYSRENHTQVQTSNELVIFVTPAAISSTRPSSFGSLSNPGSPPVIAPFGINPKIVDGNYWFQFAEAPNHSASLSELLPGQNGQNFLSEHYTSLRMPLY